MFQRILALGGAVLIGASSLCAAPVSFTVLHMNDQHTRFLPSEARWSKADPKPLVGGVVAMKAAVAQEREGLESVLVLDAGDWLTGTPISDMELDGVIGGPYIKLMNGLGLDASTIGNHEFDNGVANIYDMVHYAEFDVLSANLFQDGNPMAQKPYEIYDRGGLKVGVIGLILDGLEREVGGLKKAKVEVSDVAKTAQAMINHLDPKTDLLILLTHQGYQEDSLLATKVTGCDLIVGGHSHTRLKSPVHVNDIYIVQAGSGLSNLGRVDMMVEDDRIVSIDGKLITLYVDNYKADPEYAALVRGYKEKIDRIWNQTIAHVDVALGRNYYAESPLGNMLSDVVRFASGADIALLNSGGLRRDLASGDVQKLDIKEIMPFDNHLVTIELSGAQVLSLLEHNARVSAFKEHGVLQMSGIHCRYKVQGSEDDAKIELISPMVGGQAIDPHGLYSIVTADYVLSQDMKYMGFEAPESSSMGSKLSREVIQYLTANPEITVPALDRFQKID